MANDPFESEEAKQAYKEAIEAANLRQAVT